MVPTLTITPADALIDVPRQIRVENVAPGQTVEISALTRRNGVLWQAHAAYTAGEDGAVDLTRDAPISGDYTGLSPMGLIWSQAPVDSPSREHFNHPVTDALVTDVVARVGGAEGGMQAQATFTQRLALDGVTRHEVREEGLVGTLYLPAGSKPGSHPAVMILNGSGGGINEPRAALYASRGYAAFALAYFKAPGLSDYISNTPLEYFQTGLRWLRKKVQPKHDFVAISGQSRGGELVLLLGATFPKEVSAVVAYVPGAVVHSGQNACDPKIGREGPTWLLGGKPIPHVWENNRTATWAPFDEGPSPHRHEKAILTALQDPDAVARARIRVEDIEGPVMLLSGTDDGSWPSSLYSKMVQDKLVDVKHPYPVEWLDYENGGHSILFPYVPTTQLVYAHPVSGKISTSGGNPKDNARADQESWEGVKKFLDAAVKARAAAAAASAATAASSTGADSASSQSAPAHSASTSGDAG
ncbi:MULTISPECIES: acyl-CoA thioester hydrolase/BAAT C-terminal domain-containing protein [Achromobacter]|uniref:Acyl-CoA thioester hydrolase/BAAT C-terminal domain-containing protein n=1 Tax=Achromobacter spanius TaxID=217203 RepID=A0ABY8GY92_9BURK|nr:MULTISPECIES: acyl-CoA thioester hydrolase/BAAT C-terminal domain-containing protein [Achromobacter]WAI81023.1 acyl-CoA thioesterase/BAAT N-terminal domain-containing protein [Achromobacter spanius]WEX96541.1 acyl-CoA thioesterase/BAAT N-terminal domain-containing protein [Achromobacter sp. SS2-2022]WFP09742.1 acyl-CoA thioester hydrolase/BAAT C-terminal domain-containing protein [Achromobacter spanius]